MSWLVPFSELTPDQIRAVELSPREHRVILGGPGSGKTLVLMHRARFLAEEYQAQPEEFHVFVFTNALKEYIRSALVELDLPDDAVTTLDDWCVQFYRREIHHILPWNKVERCPDYAAIRRAVHLRLKGKRLFKFVLVDEGQDLEREAFEMIRDLAGHLTVAVDQRQQIYSEGSGVPEILRALGLKRGDVTLLETFRCSPYIVRLAAEFIADPEERQAFINQTRTSQTDIQTPFLYVASNVEDEKARLLEVLRERQLLDRSVAILLPKNAQVHSFAARCRDQGISVETRREGLDFSSGLPKVITYHSAKGLTFDSVLLPRLVESSFSGPLEGWSERLLYVGIARAVRWVYFSTVRGQELPELDRIQALAALKPAVVTVGSFARPATQVQRAAAEDDVLGIL